MKKCGIYIIKNKINDKVYIGQSVDIICRWYAHKNSANGNKQDSYTKIHKAMHELGTENFYIEIGRGAILLNKILDLKLTYIREKIEERRKIKYF